MLKNKTTGEVRSQLHLYCEPKLYNEFKEAVKQYNETGNTDISISELIREFMKEFIRNQNSNNNGGVKLW